MLNTAVVMGLKTIQHKVVSPVLAVSLICTILLTPFVFFTAKLGWWDTIALNVERFYAVKEDGEAIPVPSNYWGSFSVRMAQQRLLWDKTDGFFPTGTYGITLDRDIMDAANARSFDLSDGSEANVVDSYFANPDNRLTRFVQSYHQWAVARSANKPNWFYNLYPHHIFSDPFEFDDFKNLDLNDIVAYRYSIKSTYLDYVDGKFTRSVVMEAHHDIPVE